MALQVYAVGFGAHDPRRLADFWRGVLRIEAAVDQADGGLLLHPNADTGFRLRFTASDEPKLVPNQAHFDLTSSSADDMERTVARALELGGSHLDIGQGPDAPHVVMADPEGNEFCVIPPGNGFLADTARIGALSCDGTQQVGYFWSRALDWPLVWDQDEETAIQSPLGGSKISWGGPPVEPKVGPSRVRLELAPVVDHAAEADRLVRLGATQLDIHRVDGDRVPLRDPDGNDFYLLTGSR